MTTKKQIIKGSHGTKSLPSNIREFIKDKPDMKKTVERANGWLHGLTGRNFCGGTAVGKHYGTLVLDIQYQGGEDGVLRLCRQEIGDKKQFVKVFNDNFEIAQKHQG